MLQRSLLIGVTLILLLITGALLITEASRDNPLAAEQTDYASLDAASPQSEIHTIPQTSNLAEDARILSLIQDEQLEDSANQGIPPEDIELDYGSAGLSSPN